MAETTARTAAIVDDIRRALDHERRAWTELQYQARRRGREQGRPVLDLEAVQPEYERWAESFRAITSVLKDTDALLLDLRAQVASLRRELGYEEAS